MSKKRAATQQRRPQAPFLPHDDHGGLVDALKVARKALVDLALMAAPERREEAWRLVAVTAAKIKRLVRDPKVYTRTAVQQVHGASGE